MYVCILTSHVLFTTLAASGSCDLRILENVTSLGTDIFRISLFALFFCFLLKYYVPKRFVFVCFLLLVVVVVCFCSCCLVNGYTKQPCLSPFSLSSLPARPHSFLTWCSRIPTVVPGTKAAFDVWFGRFPQGAAEFWRKSRPFSDYGIPRQGQVAECRMREATEYEENINRRG